MNILVTNDDGIEAVGINMLAKALTKYGNVVVVAPDKGMSGASHSFNMGNLTFSKKNQIKGVVCYHTNGTPVDCVRLALGILNMHFDLVFSGINNGLNLGTDVLYSGTVAAAREGIVEGVPSIAISTDIKGFDIVSNELESLLALIINKKLYSYEYVLNVNFPTNKYLHSKGIKASRQGIKIYHTEYTEIEPGLYQQCDKNVIKDNDEATDVRLAENGYISLTPLDIDQTHHDNIVLIKENI